jgi:hypothetical protein
MIFCQYLYFFNNLLLGLPSYIPAYRLINYNLKNERCSLEVDMNPDLQLRIAGVDGRTILEWILKKYMPI